MNEVHRSPNNRTPPCKFDEALRPGGEARGDIRRARRGGGLSSEVSDTRVGRVPNVGSPNLGNTVDSSQTRGPTPMPTRQSIH